MIAMVLGLIVIAGVGSLFIANKQTYNTSEGLSEYQENVRFLFEMMTKDIRQADGTPCRKRDAKFGPQSSIPGLEWNDGIRGYTDNESSPDKTFGSGTAERIPGTDALRVTGSVGRILNVTQHTGDIFSLDGNPSGTLLIVCDLDSATIFPATVNGATIIDQSGATNGSYPPPNSQISGLAQTLWYLGCNGLANCDTAEGRSVYRAKNNLATSGGESPSPLVNGVSNLQFEYLIKGASDYSNTVTYWPAVIAVRITLDMAPPKAGGITNTTTGQLSPRLTHVIALRNRIQP